MNTLVFWVAIFVSLIQSSCNTTKNHDSGLLASSVPAASALGCYATSGHTGSGNSTLAAADKICIESTPKSKSGAYSFTFSSMGSVLNTIGANLAVSQPKCPNCYVFEGLNTKVVLNGDLQGVKSINSSYAGSDDFFKLTKASAPLPLIGCYSTSSHKGIATSPLAASDKVCIESSPKSKSGAYSFTFSSKGTVLNTIGANLAVSQPKCPNCYAFEGLNTKVAVNGDLQGVKTINVKYAGSDDSFNIQKANAPQPFLGCYKTSGHTGLATSPLSGSDKVCIESSPKSKSGAYSFTFSSQGSVLNTVGANMAVAQPKCPNCYAFEGLGTKIALNGDLQAIKSISVKYAGSDDAFKIGKI